MTPRPIVTVLIVEDDDSHAEILNHIFAEQPNVSLLRARSLEEARSMIGQAHGVLLDLGLPDSDGIETLSKLIAHRDVVPILVVSANADEDHIEQCGEEGSAAYVIKGTDNRIQLRASLRHAIGRMRRLARERAKFEKIIAELEEKNLQLKAQLGGIDAA